jgi:hypothetical protein
LTKNGLHTFWATFSQTPLVTLLETVTGDSKLDEPFEKQEFQNNLS